MLTGVVRGKVVQEPAAIGAGLGFRPDIEGLRAIAILLVVGYHARISALSGGYIGVDVFFVLSGYLITGLLVREIEQTGTISLPSFYARRARRLLPALALTLLVTILVGIAIYPPFEANQGAFGATAVSTAAYASNLYFAASATDYFGPNREQNPLLHTWSLSVEEQFYLLWPLFIMFALSVFSWQSRQGINRRRLLLWMAAAVAISFALSFYLTSRRQPWAYFLSPARAWEFGLGAIFVLLPDNTGKSRPFIGWLGLAGIFAGAVFFSENTAFPGIAALLPAVSTGLVLRASSAQQDSSMVRMLSVGPLQEIGRLSYSWYLWHWPVLVFASAIIGNPSFLMRAGLVVLSLGLSVASYRLVENPIRHNRRLASRPIYSFAMAGLLAVVGLAASFGWRYVSFQAAESPSQAPFTSARLDGPVGLTSDCSANYFDRDVKACNFGDRGSTVPIVLLGDSHAAQWLPALELISAKRGWRLVTMVKSACAMVDAPFFYSLLGRTYAECGEWRKNALEQIRQIRPLVTVITSSENYSFQDDEWRDGISKVLQQVTQSSQNVLILRDTPSADFDVPTCLARRLWRPAFIPSEPCEFSFPSTSKAYEFQKTASRQYKNVLVADMSSNICPGGVCTPERNGMILFRDSNHAERLPYKESSRRTL